MARTDIHLDAMLRHLGAAYYESLHGRATRADVTRALDTVEEHLNELIPIAPDRRQRRIVLLGDPDLRSEPRLGELPHVLEYAVDIDRAALDRLFAEYLHAFDQSPDAVGFNANELG